jgi:hypothetical protein
MKRSINLWLALIMVSVLSACSTYYQYHSAEKAPVDLKQYKSFAWAPKVPNRRPANAISNKNSLGDRLNAVNNNRYYNNPESASKIESATVSALQSKGLVMQERNPDLLVRYATLVDRGTRTNYYSAPYYGRGFGWGGPWGWRGGWAYGGAWGWGGYAGAYPVRETFKEGVLAIELLDARTRETIWIGYGSGELSRNPQKSINELPKVVDGIFKRLPVQQ